MVLTGYRAHICVSSTVQEVVQKSHEFIIVENAIGDRVIPGVEGKELTRVTLAELTDVFGTVVQSSDIR